MRRRQALIALIGSGVLLPIAFAARAQPAGKSATIGLLDAGAGRETWWAAFRQQLGKHGYVEGRNITFESRVVGGKLELLPAMAQDLVRLNVDVIVTSGTPAALAAKRASDKIPIVMATGADQVSLGLVDNLARPGGNVTGVSSLVTELTSKRFELLQEILPKLSRLAVLWNQDTVTSSTSVRDLQAVAGKSKVALQSLRVRSEEEIAAAFAAMAKGRADAVVVVNSPFIYGERRLIVELALKHRLPSVYGAFEYVESGGLLAYAPSYAEFFRRAADYVDRILKGARPGDLPIEQPTRIQLAVNLKTARGIGVTIPPVVLARADRVIE